MRVRTPPAQIRTIVPVGTGDLNTQMIGVREGLVEMASLVLSQVELAVDAWETLDTGLAERVMAQDEAIDEHLVDLDARIYEVHRSRATCVCCTWGSSPQSRSSAWATWPSQSRGWPNPQPPGRRCPAWTR